MSAVGDQPTDDPLTCRVQTTSRAMSGLARSLELTFGDRADGRCFQGDSGRTGATSRGHVARPASTCSGPVTLDALTAGEDPRGLGVQDGDVVAHVIGQ